MATAATLSRGIKSVHLSLDTPVDVNTGKVRNDLSGVRVWYSTNPNFNPLNSEGELAFNGLSLDITVPNLQDDTEYYTRHAFISAIDPNTFTISQPLVARTYDENIAVYGNLTNPTSFINTESDGTGGEYSFSTGVFRVYKYSQEVTGASVVYAQEADSLVGGLQYTLNPTTGEYQVTGQTDDYASVGLTATYEGVTISTTLVAIRVRKGIDGTTARQLSLTADGNVFVFKDNSATVSDTAQVTVRATQQNFTGTLVWTAKAYTVNGVFLGDIPYTQPDNLTLIINKTDFNPSQFNNTVAYVVVTAGFGALITDSFTIYRINNGTEQVIVELSNQNEIITAFFDESVPASAYQGSGTQIRVREGNNYLTVDNTIPFSPGTWTVTSTSSSYITPDQTPTIFGDYIEYGDHSNMTAIRARIDYTIQGKTSSGRDFTIVTTQSFVKSVAGAPGFTATTVRLTCDSLVFIKFKDGTHSSSVVNIFAEPQNVTQPIYTWEDGINPPVVKDSTLDPNANQYQFPRPAELGTYNITVTVTSKNNPALNTAADSITIAYIEEGSDAFTFLFKDPNIVLSANNLGVVENNITSVTNHIIGAQGIRLLEAGPGKDIVYTIDSTENCTAVMGNIVNLWNHEFTISGSIFNNASISNAKVVIKCQIPNGPSFLQTCYIAKVKKGDTGAAGAAAVTVDLVSEADVVAAQADGTGYALPTGNEINLYVGGAEVTTGVVYGGTATKNGLTLTVSQTTGAVTLSGTNWTSNQESFNITATYSGVTYTTQYTISKSRAGSDAVFVDLLSEADVVSANSDGTGYTLPSGNSLRLFKGGAQITSGVVYSGNATQNGLTLTINSSTGAITLSGASWTSVQERFTLTAAYEGKNYTYQYKITKSRQGATGATGATGPQGPAGTAGTAAPKVTSGYIYYALSSTSNPGTPSASSFNFSTGAFSGLTGNWSTSITMTGNGTYWASWFNVTESSAGSGVGTPTFSTPFTHQNFSGLVTFTDVNNSLSGYATQTYATNAANTAASNAVSDRPTYTQLSTQGFTTIHGGNISTGTLSVDKILAGTSATSNGATFGFGTGSVIAGIATAGFFKSTNSNILGLGVLSSSNVAFSASTVHSGNAGGFGNRNGYGIDDIASGNSRTIAGFASASQAGFFQLRNQGGEASGTAVDPNTRVYLRVCFNDGTPVALQVGNRDGQYYANIGNNNVAGYFYREGGYNVSLASSSYAINTSGPVNISGALSVTSLTVNGNSITSMPSVAIPSGQIAYGTGSGITSTSDFTWSNGIVFQTSSGEKRVWWTMAGRNVYLAGISNGTLTLWDSGLGNYRWITDTSGNFTASGSVTGNSDIRLKENILTISDALNKVCSLRGVTYNRIGLNIRQTGVIAQEVEKVLPEAIVKMDDEQQTLTVAYGNMIGILIEAIKELKSEVDTLKTKIN